jgi:hypothetical protein
VLISRRSVGDVLRAITLRYCDAAHAWFEEILEPESEERRRCFVRSLLRPKPNREPATGAALTGAFHLRFCSSSTRR